MAPINPQRPFFPSIIARLPFHTSGSRLPFARRIAPRRQLCAVLFTFDPPPLPLPHNSNLPPTLLTSPPCTPVRTVTPTRVTYSVISFALLYYLFCSSFISALSILWISLSFSFLSSSESTRL